MSGPHGPVRAATGNAEQHPIDQPARHSALPPAPEHVDPRPAATGRATLGNDRPPEYRPERFIPEHERVDEYRRERIAPGHFRAEPEPAASDEFALSDVEAVTAPPFAAPAPTESEYGSGSDVEPFDPAGGPVAEPAKDRYELPPGPFAGAPANGSGSPIAGSGSPIAGSGSPVVGPAARSTTPTATTAGRPDADEPADTAMSWADSVWARTAAPEAQTPETERPETETPEAEIFATETPEARTPEEQRPEAGKPEEQRPEAGTPEAETFAPETPEAEIPEELVRPRPISAMPISPSTEYRHLRAESAAPHRAVDEPTVEGEHGLGWLLSMSGFGGSTPVIEPDPGKADRNDSIPDHAVSDQAVPDHSLPDQAVSEHALLNHAVGDYAASDHAVPEQAAPDHVVSERAVPEEVVLGSTVPDQTIPEEAVPNRTVPDQAIPEEAVPNRTVPDQATPEEAVPNRTVPDQATPEEAVPDQAVPEEAVPEPALPGDELTAAPVPASTETAELVVESMDDVRASGGRQPVIVPAATAPESVVEPDVDIDVTEPPASITPSEANANDATQEDAETRAAQTIAEPENAPTVADPADAEQPEAEQPEAGQAEAEVPEAEQPEAEVHEVEQTDEVPEAEQAEPAPEQTDGGYPDAELPEPDQSAVEQLQAAVPEAELPEVEQADPEQAEAEPVADTTPVEDPDAEPDPAEVAVAQAEPEPAVNDAQPADEPPADQAADQAADQDKIDHDEDDHVDEATAEKTAETGQNPGSTAHAVPEKSETESPKPDPARSESRRAPIRQRRDQRVRLEARRPDPEGVIQAYTWVFDPTTLRERVEETDQIAAVIDRLTDKLEYAERDAVRARLLSLRAVASRLAGDLDLALEDGRAALGHAEATGALRDIAVTRARLAHVLQWLGEFAEADRLYTEAASPELPGRLLAEIHELAGRSAFEQERHLEAVNHFELALDLRREEDPEMIERIELALDVVTERTAAGWGPYPRTREEILGIPEAPRPLRDERSGLWGYVGAVPPRYAQAQPFAEGLAWVRRPESPAWELIDQAGRLVVDASSGYRAAGRFAEGLAWVSRDEAGGWDAVDRLNRVIVPGGFEDAKPFHHGLALVKRGGWGAVDQYARVVVQPRYRGFATALSSGGRVDGFTDEGLAVIDAGDRFGVLDRTGQLLVAPTHAAVLIHPTAFLIADRYGLWGALDRAGEPLVGAKYRDRADVLDAIARVHTDVRPLL